MASRGLTESMIKSLQKNCAAVSLKFLVLFWEIFFFNKDISTAIACFCFCSVLLFCGMILLAVYGFIGHVTETFQFCPLTQDMDYTGYI